MGLRRRVQPVDHLGGDVDGGVEAEGQVGLVDVVVDHPDAHDGDAGPREQVRRRQRALPPIGIRTSILWAASTPFIWAIPASSRSGATRAGRASSPRG